MKELYWENQLYNTLHTVSIGKYEVFTMWSVWRFRSSSGGLETLAEAYRTLGALCAS